MLRATGHARMVSLVTRLIDMEPFFTFYIVRPSMIIQKDLHPIKRWAINRRFVFKQFALDARAAPRHSHANTLDIGNFGTGYLQRKLLR